MEPKKMLVRLSANNLIGAANRTLANKASPLAACMNFSTPVFWEGKIRKWAAFYQNV
jgi:hypothetical protein